MRCPKAGLTKSLNKKKKRGTLLFQKRGRGKKVKKDFLESVRQGRRSGGGKPRKKGHIIEGGIRPRGKGAPGLIGSLLERKPEQVCARGRVFLKGSWATELLLRP